MPNTQSCQETVQTLLARLRAGGEEQQSAWAEFFERFAPKLYRDARLRGLDPHDADDIVQQCMLQILRKIGDFQYDPDRGHFAGWMQIMVERKIINLWRTRKRKVDTLTDDPQPAEKPLRPDELWDRQWQVEDMLECLDQVTGISPRRMEAFRLYVLEGVPAAEVARRMDITVDNVYVIRVHVMNKIKARMKRLIKIEPLA